MSLLMAGLAGSSILDIRKHRISMRVLGILLIAGLGFRIYDRELFEMVFLLRLLPGLLCMLLTWITRGAVGLGDGCMILVLGLFLNWEELMSVCMMSLCLSGLIGLLLLVGFRKKKNYEIPFVPFLLVSFVLLQFVF